jgi:hypothetical protein
MVISVDGEERWSNATLLEATILEANAMAAAAYGSCQ